MTRLGLRPAAVLAAAAVLLAASDSARAFTSLSSGNPVWPGATMTYHVNAASFGSVPGGASVVQSSFSTWTADPVATIVCQRSGDTSRTAVSDGFSDIYFVSSGWSLDRGILAVTYVSFAGSVIDEADMLVNGDVYTWSTSTPSPSCTDAFDLQATVTHEAGHAIGMGHSSENQNTCEPASPSFDPVLCDATMYYAGGPCDAEGRTLECDDRAGIRFLYPPGGTRHADWTPSGFVASPSGGSVVPGDQITITGKALNTGAIATSGGVAALFVSSTPSPPGGAPASTKSIAATNPCRTRDVSFTHAFSAGDAGTRYLVIKLDNGDTTTEFDESDSSNAVALGPFTVVAGPTLEADAASLTFGGTVGGASPPAQTVTVTNGGGGTFTWNATDDQAWLSVSPGSGAPGASFDVSVNTSGLAAATYTGHVTITAAGVTGSPVVIPVTLQVVTGPVLSVTPTSLTFNAAPNGPLPASQSLSVTNPGSGTLSWSASDDATWLSLSPGSGTNAGTVTVSVTSTNLGAGTHSATITLTAGTAGGSPATIPVTLNLSTGILSVTPPSLAFSAPLGGVAPPSQQLSVTNAGTGSLAFTASSNRTWLAVAPGSGNAPATLTVSVDPTGLGAGTQTGTITVISTGAAGSPAAIGVTFQITTSPSIQPTPPSLSFAAVVGGSAPSQTLTIRNDGAGTLNYTITDDGAWLTVTPATGTLVAGAQRAHQVAASAAGLGVGPHPATITITDPAADDSPKLVPVTFDVTLSPPLSVTPTTLTFAATAAQPTPPSQSLALSTGGSPTAAWTVTSSETWLSASPASGTGDATVAITASAQGVASGTLHAVLTVAAPSLSDSPRTVDVTFTVAPGPRLSVTPPATAWTVQRFDPLPAATVVTVSNTGTGSLSWTVSGGPAWLSVTPPSGSAPGSFSAQPNRTDLTPGRYTGTLVVSASGAYDSPARVDLIYDVVGPALTMTPARVVFDLVDGVAVSPASASVSLTSGMAWTAQANRPWISVSPTSGNGNAVLAVALQGGASLPIGLLDGAVVVTSAGAANSPAPIPVVVHSRPKPSLSAWPPALDLHVAVGSAAQPGGTLALDEAGDGAGTWSVVASPSWLTPATTSGAHGASVVLTVDPTGLAAGVFSGTLRLSTEGDLLDVPVTLTVHDTPSLVAEPKALELVGGAGGTSSAESLDVTNVGAAPSSFTVTTSDPWLHVTGGLVAPSTLSVSADASTLAAGAHAATLTLHAGSVATSVPVSFAVVPAGAPVADFSATPGSGCGPLTVTFHDLTSGSGAHAWAFEGAGTSTLTEPTVSFAAPGVHVVALTVSNASGSSTRRRSVTVHQPPLAFAGLERRVAFEAAAETRIRLDGARVAAAAPARIANLEWRTSRGTFEDTGTTTSSLERPTLVLANGRGGVQAALSLDVTDDAGCRMMDQATVSVLSDLDADSDGRIELLDNCPGSSNSSQADFDADGAGDRCDDCPTVADALQADANGNGVGDACDPAFVPTLALGSARGRACAGHAEVPGTVTAPALLRRVSVTLPSRPPTGARAAGVAAAAGGTAVVDAQDPTRVELRVPAGVLASGPVMAVDVPLVASDQFVDVTCGSARVGLAAGDRAMPCTAGSVDLRADGDVAPVSGPDGRVDIGDIVRLLRASVNLDAFTADEAARGDIAPGSTVGGTWQARSDCVIDVGDVVVALRASVGLVTLP